MYEKQKGGLNLKTGDKGLSSLQLTMMALGTVIGGSFFLGSAVAIHAAGPGIILAYILGGGLVYVILFALSEMTVANPAPGSFRTFAEHAFGPLAGFVVGWVYWTGLVLAMSSEAVAVSVILRQWFPGASLILTGAVVVLAVTLLNLLGADRLSKLESGLALVKLLAIAGFIAVGAALIAGILPDSPRVGAGELFNEAFFPNGLSGLAGSMLIVMFAYAGFEVIGLAASESANPHQTVPRAIAYTVFGLVGLYVLSMLVLLPLIPTSVLTTEQSPLVAALLTWNLSWAGSIVNVVLVTAILSTMLAAMFGLGRMIRSLAEEGHAPNWIKDKSDIPYRGILFSGAAMLAGLGLSTFLPQEVYLFLVSSGGFSLLFSYVVILATHFKLRRKNGCPPNGKCQLPGYPVTSLLALGLSIAIIVSMPLIPGQGPGLLAGLALVLLFAVCYFVQQAFAKRQAQFGATKPQERVAMQLLQFETAKELTPVKSQEEKATHKKIEARRKEKD